MRADLKGGEVYSLRIFEDEYSRNMSSVRRNQDYTALNGGGEGVYNFVNIASVRLIRVGD